MSEPAGRQGVLGLARRHSSSSGICSVLNHSTAALSTLEGCGQLVVRATSLRRVPAPMCPGRPAHSYAQLRYIYSAWLQGDICWVEDVYVGDQYRGLGVGRALMRAIESRACELGCVQLQLDANERNEIAVALYESEGYSATGSTWDGGRYLFFRRKISAADATPTSEGDPL